MWRAAPAGLTSAATQMWDFGQVLRGRVKCMDAGRAAPGPGPGPGPGAGPGAAARPTVQSAAAAAPTATGPTASGPTTPERRPSPQRREQNQQQQQQPQQPSALAHPHQQQHFHQPKSLTQASTMGGVPKWTALAASTLGRPRSVSASAVASALTSSAAANSSSSSGTVHTSSGAVDTSGGGMSTSAGVAGAGGSLRTNTRPTYVPTSPFRASARAFTLKVIYAPISHPGRVLALNDPAAGVSSHTTTSMT